MKKRLWCMVFMVFATLHPLLGDDFVFIIDKPVVQDGVPTVEIVFSLLENTLVSGFDRVGLAQALNEPFFVLPPTIVTPYIKTKISALLKTPVNSPRGVAAGEGAAGRGG
ncbi:MAG: hypothetical protein LBT33_10850, partial [Spirochaetia bacterium]|nr:hypothetical protein [Spirochaetia bacterium]